MKTLNRLSACAIPLSAFLLLGCEREDRVLGPEAYPLASSSALTSAVTDPEGDAVMSGKATLGDAAAGQGLTAEAYQDIVRAEISKRGGVFVLVMDLAAPLPASPALPPGIVLQEWTWNLNTDPGFPAGFPFAPPSAPPPEFMVHVLWDGTTFTGNVIDRRPLLAGGEVVITSVTFDIKGARVKVSVAAAVLGNPSSFTWVARTNDWPTPLGSNSLRTLDRAPDMGPAPWPE